MLEQAGAGCFFFDVARAGWEGRCYLCYGCHAGPELGLIPDGGWPQASIYGRYVPRRDAILFWGCSWCSEQDEAFAVIKLTHIENRLEDVPIKTEM